MNGIILERACFPVTLRCNLRCRLCAERSPYYRKPYHPLLNELISQMDALLTLTEHVGKLDLTGGEPFLRKDLPQFIRYIYDHHRGKIDQLRVTTNGTLLPPDEFVKAAKLWGDAFFVIVDHYDVSVKSQAVDALLNEAGILHELRDYSGDLHCDGWVDYGDLRRKHSDSEARKLFHKCVVPKLGFFSCIVNGHIFPCAKARILYENGIVDVSMDAFDSELTETGKKERFKALLGDEVMEACKYCNGLCEDSPRFTPAEQLDAGEKPAELSRGEGSFEKMMFYTQTYNNEGTIARTIESVLNQTRKEDFLYIVVDNGSTDNTGNIIADYASSDPRVVSVKCEHNDILAGLLLPGKLLNLVLKADARYFSIIDGDDTICDSFLDHVLSVQEKFDPDMIVPGYRRIDAASGEIINERVAMTDLVVSGKEKADRFYELRAMLLCQWGKCYKVNSLRKRHNIFAGIMANIPKWYPGMDTVGVLNAFYYCDKAVFTKEALYNYYIYKRSAINAYYPDRYMADVMTLLVYKTFLGIFGPISKLNNDYCYAIYLSLLELTLENVINTETVGDSQKLEDIYNMLRENETRTMLTLDADPEFRNLADRGSFIEPIIKYVREQSSKNAANVLSDKIMGELAQYKHFETMWEDLV